MIDLWFAPLHAMAAMQRQALAHLLPPPAASVTFPGDLALAFHPAAAWWPVIRVAGAMAPGTMPWLGVGVRMPMGACGVVTLGGRA